MTGHVLGGFLATLIGVGTLVVGIVGGNWPMVLIGLFISILILPALPIGLWRLVREPDSLRIGPTGLWLPAAGVVPWVEIESIRVEDAAGSLSSLHPEEPRPINQVLRLGILLRLGSEVRGRTVVDRFYMGLASRSRGPRPLGVYEQELPVTLEEVLLRIGRYHPIDAFAEEAPSSAVPSFAGAGAADPKAAPDAPSREAIERAREAMGRDPSGSPITPSDGGPQPPA
jgi:hypothetical protein